LIGGVDETVAYTITARHVYIAEEILFDYRFADIIHNSESGDRFFDYGSFHQVQPID
jgi:inward rectifier potassium channel